MSYPEDAMVGDVVDVTVQRRACKDIVEDGTTYVMFDATKGVMTQRFYLFYFEKSEFEKALPSGDGTVKGTVTEVEEPEKVPGGMWKFHTTVKL